MRILSNGRGQGLDIDDCSRYRKVYKTPTQTRPLTFLARMFLYVSISICLVLRRIECAVTRSYIFTVHHDR